MSNPPLHKLLAGAGVELFAAQDHGPCDSQASFFAVSPDQLHRLILASRAGAIVVTLLLGVVVLLFARRLFGDAAGVLALALFVIEPVIAAHGHLTTGDMPASAGMVAALAADHLWLGTRRRRWLLLTGLALGLGMLAKATALLVIPVIVLAEMLAAEGAWRIRLTTVIRPVLVVAAVAWSLLCLAYAPFAQVTWHWSTPLSYIAPPQWFEAIAAASADVSASHLDYLNGSIVTADHRFWLYYPEALALKTSLGLLALGVVGTVVAWRSPARRALVHLLMPAALVVGAAAVGTVEVGVRYILPVFPLLVITASAAAMPGVQRRLRVAAVAAAVTAVAASHALHGTDDIGYFNEAAGGAPEHYLADSNIDWGQDCWRLRDWWEAQGRPALQIAYFGTLPCSAYGVPATAVGPGHQSVHGLVVISITRLVITGDVNTKPYAPGPYRALQLQPAAARIGTSMLVYRLP